MDSTPVIRYAPKHPIFIFGGNNDQSEIFMIRHFRALVDFTEFDHAANKKILIRQFLHQYNIKHLSRPRQLRGIDRPFFIRVGLWASRRDAYDVEDMLRERNAIELELEFGKLKVKK